MIQLAKRGVALAVCQLLVAPAQAATLTVSSNQDDNGSGCTLRQAIESINEEELQGQCEYTGQPFGSEDQIDFNLPGVNTITLQRGELTIARGKNITINKNGGSNLTVQGGNLDSSDTNPRVFSLIESELSLHNLVISGGTAEEKGGGIYANNGHLNLVDSTVSGNVSSVRGGGIYAKNSSHVYLLNSGISDNDAFTGGGIYLKENSRVELFNSRVSRNVGSGLSNQAPGIAAEDQSEVFLDSSRVFDNEGAESIFVSNNSHLSSYKSTISGGDVSVNGVSLQYDSTADIVSSVVSKNKTYGVRVFARSKVEFINSLVSKNGVGVYANASGVLELSSSLVSGNSNGRGVRLLSHSTATLTNTTVSNNSGPNDGGGISADFGSYVNLINSTVSSNSSGKNGGGIYAKRGSVGEIRNSIVSGNSAKLDGAEIYSDMSGSVTTNNANLFGDRRHASDEAFTNFVPDSNDIVATNNRRKIALSSILTPLTDNGGPTMTHGLVEHSPALDSADNTICGTDKDVDLDQRGQPRDDGNCDIGAFEGFIVDTSFFVVPLKESGKSVIFGL